MDDELSVSSIAGLMVGQTVYLNLEPPLTLWDQLLWRLFHIERCREAVPTELTVVSVTTSQGSVEP